ncbi:hypothetical protein VP01_3021g3, partial [Puccinia sorghi]
VQIVTDKSLSWSNSFSKLNLQGAYSLIHISEGQEWLTAMRTSFCGGISQLYSNLLQEILGSCSAYSRSASTLSRQEPICSTVETRVSQLISPFFGCYCLFRIYQHGLSSIQKITQFLNPQVLKCFKNYFKTIFNPTYLLQKNTPFVFTNQELLQFEALKKSFTLASILAHFSKLA